MSFFLEILRCILCCEEEERRDHFGNRYSEVPSYETFSRAFSPSTTSTHFISQSNAQTTSRNIQSQSSSNSSKLPPTSISPYSVRIRETINDQKNSIPTKLPETLTASFVKPKITVDSGINTKKSVSIKPEIAQRTSEKSHEFHQKPNISSLSSSPSSSTKPAPSSKLLPSLSKLPLSASKPISSLSGPPLSSPSSSGTPSSSSKPSPSAVKSTLSPAPSKLPLSASKPISSLSGPPLSSPKPASSPSPSGTPSSSSKPYPSAVKSTLSPAPSNPTNHQTKANYIWDPKRTSIIYVIPEDIKDLIKKDIVPEVLKKPLSTLTYKDYFSSLLYAEDFYIEKWSKFKLFNVTLKLHEAAIYNRSFKYKILNQNQSDKKDDKIFVAFEIDSVRERRPFLLSRDFVFVQPSGSKAEPFQGIINRVVKSTLVLVEFGEDFHAQHHSTCKYDVSFSFNRVCLKRCHQAIAAAASLSFQNILFPGRSIRKSLLASPLLCIDYKLDQEQVTAIRQILSLQCPPPYLIEGPMSISKAEGYEKNSKQLSRTGLVVREAVLQIYRTFPSSRILVCAPINSTCDVLMGSLKKEIPESDMFRANAAFRERDEVPLDILSSCVYEGECFACPSLQGLRNFKVILSTFVSSFRLHNEGIVAGHFSHIFLLDASSATEPETMVALANLANETTAVVITGAPGGCPGWVRSDMAQQNGLTISYFERLRESKLYVTLDPKSITKLEDKGRRKIDW